MDEEIKIVKANINDLDGVLGIYKYYVENTEACFDEVTPDTQKIINLLNFIKSKRLPYYVAKINDKVIGYCYATQYRRRSAYKYTVESSIYIDTRYTGKGVARKLFDKVHQDVKDEGFKQIVAVVVDHKNNHASKKFHKAMGFTEQGRLKKVGYKFDQWLDIILFQKEV